MRAGDDAMSTLQSRALIAVDDLAAQWSMYFTGIDPRWESRELTTAEAEEAVRQFALQSGAAWAGETCAICARLEELHGEAPRPSNPLLA